MANLGFTHICAR